MFNSSVGLALCAAVLIAAGGCAGGAQLRGGKMPGGSGSAAVVEPADRPAIRAAGPIADASSVALSAKMQAVWRPEPEALALLAPEEDLGIFSIRPPAGLTRVTQEGGGGDRSWSWQGAAREDGAVPLLTVAVSDPRAQGSEAFKILQMADKMRLDAEWALNMTLSLYGSSPEFKRGKAERGSIGDRPFVRARFSSPFREDSPALARGVLYVHSRPDRVFEIWAIAAEPDHEAFLKTAEASILTFRER